MSNNKNRQIKKSKAKRQEEKNKKFEAGKPSMSKYAKKRLDIALGNITVPEE